MEKKIQSKRTNGAAKPKAAKLETKAVAKSESKPKVAKPRARKSPAISSGEPEVLRLTEEEIAFQAYVLWEGRGRPLGSPEVDWYKAKERLREGAR